MGSNKNRICVWSPQNVTDYRDFGWIPKCSDHEHMGRTEASACCQELLYTTRNIKTGKAEFFYEAKWVDSRRNSKVQAIVFFDPREWSIKKSGLYDVHQLVPVGG